MAQGVMIIAEQRDGDIRKISYELVSEGKKACRCLRSGTDSGIAWFKYKR